MTAPAHFRLRTAVAAAAATLTIAATAACGSSGTNESGASGTPDNGTEITMWTRAGTESQTKALVDAYNAGHKNQATPTAVIVAVFFLFPLLLVGWMSSTTGRCSARPR